MNQFVQVVEDEGDDPVELPAEVDGTLLVSTLNAQFTGACGLKYRSHETQVYRGVRVSEGRLFPPDGDWSGIVFTTVYPKEKRKGECLENPTAKTKKLAKRCTDLIILGLPWKTAEEDLRKHFAQFGELVMVQVKRDMVTKQSRGYGFIRFSDYESQVKALSQKHPFDGRMCDLKIPNSKEGMQEVVQKVYVGRLTEDITADDLRVYFAQFGDVTEVYMPKPFRAFAFITFSDSDVASSLLGDDHIIKGVSVHVSNATPRGAQGAWGDAGSSHGSSRGGQRGSPFVPTGDLQSSYGAKAGGGAQGGFGGGGGAYGGVANVNPNNQMQLTNAMMAAAQAAMFNVLSQAAGGMFGNNVAAGGGQYGGGASGGYVGGFNQQQVKQQVQPGLAGGSMQLAGTAGPAIGAYGGQVQTSSMQGGTSLGGTGWTTSGGIHAMDTHQQAGSRWS